MRNSKRTTLNTTVHSQRGVINLAPLVSNVCARVHKFLLLSEQELRFEMAATIEQSQACEKWCEDTRRILALNDASIESLDIDGSLHEGLQHSQLVSLFDAMRKDKGLTSFSLRHLDMSHDAILALVPAIKNSQSLRTIVIEEIVDTNNCLPELLAVALYFNRSIQQLVLRSCWAESVSSFSIGSMLNSMLHLRELNLCHNHLDANAATAIGIALRQNDSLKVLDLTGNSMNCEAVCGLALGLSQNNSLEKVVLDFNSFGDKGCVGLSRMLEKNTSLQELHFFGNRVTGTGASSLAQALKVNSSLKALILSFNRIGDEGVIALAECLTINTALEKVWFPSNSVGHDGMRVFADKLPKMKGLKQLNVGLLLDDEIEDELARALKYNLNLSVLYMEKPIFFEEEGEISTVASTMDFYLRCNRSGRGLLRERTFPGQLWNQVLASAITNSRSDGTPDALHYMIRSNPALFDIS